MNPPMRGFIGIAAACVLLFSPVSDTRSAPNGSRGFSSREKEYLLDFQYSVMCDQPGYYEAAIREAERIGSGSSVTTEPVGVPRWGIVSHHLLIKDLIAGYFQRLAREISPQTFVIIGPNHFAEGHHRVAISSLGWKTPFGILPSDEHISSALIASGAVAVDEPAFIHEHSIGALVPFIKYYFPEAHVVPIIFRSDTDTLAAASLAGALLRCGGSGVFFLASLDFSHYKTSAVAQREDAVTLKVLEALDPAKSRNAFVDSHAAFFTVLRSCAQMGATSIEIVDHTNSGIIENLPDAGCTSYINTIFRAP